MRDGCDEFGAAAAGRGPKASRDGRRGVQVVGNGVGMSSHEKALLADPVAAYRQRYGAGGEWQHAVEQAHARYVALQEVLKGAKALAQRQSRLIGEAKRRGEPVETLLEAMRTHSAAVKATQRELGEAKAEILGFFPSGQDRPDAAARVYASAPPDADTVRISPMEEGDAPAWNAYCECNPATSIYHRAEWRGLFEGLFGHELCYYLARDAGDRVVGILPLTRLKSRLFGDYMVSVPYFNYGGAVGDSPAIEHRLMGAAAQTAKGLGVRHIEYRDDIARPGMPVRTDKVEMILELPQDEATLFERIGSKLRAQIRRPQREKPEIHIGGVEYLDDFYRVFARNMRDLGTPVFPKALFREILQRFPDRSRIVSIRHRGRPVAAGFLLGHRDTLEIPSASTLREANPLSMNMLLYWTALSYAIRQGYRHFDFGRSSRDSGTYRFKRQWGARPRPLHWHYWLKAGLEPPRLNPDNPKYALAIKCWKRLPVSVTRWLGPGIVKHLP